MSVNYRSAHAAGEKPLLPLGEDFGLGEVREPVGEIAFVSHWLKSQSGEARPVSRTIASPLFVFGRGVGVAVEVLEFLIQGL